MGAGRRCVAFAGHTFRRALIIVLRTDGRRVQRRAWRLLTIALVGIQPSAVRESVSRARERPPERCSATCPHAPLICTSCASEPGAAGAGLGRGAYPSQPCRRALYGRAFEEAIGGSRTSVRCHEQSSVSGVSRDPRGAMGGSSQTGRAIQRDNSEHSGTAARRRASARGRRGARGPRGRNSSLAARRGRFSLPRRPGKTPRAPREAE